jgi:cell shape-determining protein MreC
MTEHDQPQHVHRQNGRLAADNQRLRNELRRHAGRILELEQAASELQQVKADLGVELEACDVLLGVAMDVALNDRRS